MSLVDQSGRPLNPATGRLSLCRGCGCDDDHACVIGGVACCWIILDIETPTGMCSACAARAHWDQEFIVSYWNPEVVAMLQRAGAAA